MNISTNMGGQTVNLSAAFPVFTPGGSPARLTQAQLQQQIAQNPADQASQYLLSHFDALAKASHKDPLNHFSFDIPVNSAGVPLPDDDNSIDQNELAFVAGFAGKKDEMDDTDLAALAEAPEVTQKQDMIPTPFPIVPIAGLTFDEVSYNDNDGMDVPKKITTVDVANEFNTKLDTNHDGTLDKTELDAAAGGISIPEEHDNTLGKFLSQNRDKFSGPITLDSIARVAAGNDPTKLEQVDLGNGNDILPLPDPGLSKNLKFRHENGRNPGFGFPPAGLTGDAEPILKEIDANSDGVYTQDEIHTYQASLPPQDFVFSNGSGGIKRDLANFLDQNYAEIAGKDNLLSYDELRNRAGADGVLAQSDMRPTSRINPIFGSIRPDNSQINQLMTLLKPLMDYLQQYLGNQGNTPINPIINPVINPDFAFNQGVTNPSSTASALN